MNFDEWTIMNEFWWMNHIEWILMNDFIIIQFFLYNNFTMILSRKKGHDTIPEIGLYIAGVVVCRNESWNLKMLTAIFHHSFSSEMTKFCWKDSLPISMPPNYEKTNKFEIIHELHWNNGTTELYRSEINHELHWNKGTTEFYNRFLIHFCQILGIS